MNAAVFLDRDGTINEEVGYINHLDRFVLLPGAAAAIRRLRESGFKVVVVSNQSGAARGYFPAELIEQVNQKMERLLAAEGAALDGIYICAHGPELVNGAPACRCRKPQIGLLLQASRDLDIDLHRSYVVGDRLKDVEMGHNAGCKSILVLTGYGKGEKEYHLGRGPVQPDFIAADLKEAAAWIIAAAEAGDDQGKGVAVAGPERSRHGPKAGPP